jgi:hypothetical protein
MYFTLIVLVATEGLMPGSLYLIAIVDDCTIVVDELDAIERMKVNDEKDY